MLKFIQRYILSFTFGAMLIILVSCTGTKSAASETWSLVRLVSKGERIDSTVEKVEVRNCGYAEIKKSYCSAGTSNELTVTMGFDIGAVPFSVNPEVSTGLGLGRESGEEIELDTPPEGYIYRYTINKEYQVVTGKVLMQSSNGNEQTSTYAFHASCTIHVTSPDLLNCSNQPDATQLQVTAVATQAPTLPAITQVSNGSTSTEASVHGQVRWNSQPVVGTKVELAEVGEPSSYMCSGAKIASTVTDAEGHYDIAIPSSAKSNTYVVVAWLENLGWCSNLVVVAMPSTYEHDFDLIKEDLKILSPTGDNYTTANVPPLRWVAYPSASRYEIRIYKGYLSDREKIIDEFIDNDTIYPSITTLSPGTYSGYVWAYNEKYVAISYGFFIFTIN